LLPSEQEKQLIKWKKRVAASLIQHLYPDVEVQSKRKQDKQMNMAIGMDGNKRANDIFFLKRPAALRCPARAKDLVRTETIFRNGKTQSAK